jgi:ketosteroid isomerase-like protein
MQPRSSTGCLLLILAAACSRSADPAAGREALLAADRAFARATAERGGDGWVENFAPDAISFAGAAQPLEGAAAIRDHAQQMLAPGQHLSWEPTRAFISRSGDLGYTIGRWEFTSEQGSSKGSYVTIWRQQPDGSWKVVLDIGNPDPAPTPATP